MKNHKYVRRWYKPKDRKALRLKRRHHKELIKQKIANRKLGEIK